MSTSEQLRQKILEELNAQKENYGKIFIISAIAKREGTWYNILTKIIPLYSKNENAHLRKLDYGNFAIIENLISIEQLKDFIKSLSGGSTANLSLDGYIIEFSSGNFSNGYQYDSSDDSYNVGWFFKRFQFSSSSGYNRISPLISPELPLFVDSYDAILNCIGIDTSNSPNLGILICLPNYAAKIKEVKVGPTELLVTVETRDMNSMNF
jgi:hypothetical protein